MINKSLPVGTVIAGLTALVIASNAGAAVVPLDNRLPAWSDSGTSTIDFTNIDITYKNGRTKKGVTADTQFFGESTNSSQLFLNPPGTNVQTEFTGDFIIDADISSKGVLRSGSTFGFYSTEAQFDTLPGGATNPLVEYGCNKSGKACSEGMLVFGGDLIGFGWSGTAGILEFLTNNLDGWALDMWNPGTSASSKEHIYLDVGVFTLNDVSSVKAFNATADGFAVVPVPAAAWLFGSGLIALLGFAKRKRA